MKWKKGETEKRISEQRENTQRKKTEQRTEGEKRVRM